MTISEYMLISFGIFDILFQGEKSAGAKVLQNVIMLVDLISHTLEIDGNKSTSFSNSGESISK